MLELSGLASSTRDQRDGEMRQSSLGTYALEQSKQISFLKTLHDHTHLCLDAP